ncbi:MAG: DUF4298 domain-containing protein [Actinomycetaceae bacterium]|nr:DUF4298 domain-containing protein [Actinomycetaceae bacterium]
MKERVARYETILNASVEVTQNFHAALQEFARNLGEFEALKEYYGSSEYQDDLQLYRDGGLEGVACGVLSEDAVYDLVGEHYELYMRMLEVATAGLRKW